MRKRDGLMARPGDVNLSKQTESRFGITQNYINLEERKFRQKQYLVLKSETEENWAWSGRALKSANYFEFLKKAKNRILPRNKTLTSFQLLIIFSNALLLRNSLKTSPRNLRWIPKQVCSLWNQITTSPNLNFLIC